MVRMSSPNYFHQVRLEIHTVACIKVIVFSVVTLYSLVGLYPHSGGTGYVRLQGNQKQERAASSETVVCIDQNV